MLLKPKAIRLKLVDEVVSTVPQTPGLRQPGQRACRPVQLWQTNRFQRLPVMMVGGPGTTKTSTALMYFNEISEGPNRMVKRINFSSATTPFMLQ